MTRTIKQHDGSGNEAGIIFHRGRKGNNRVERSDYAMVSPLDASSVTITERQLNLLLVMSVMHNLKMTPENNASVNKPFAFLDDDERRVCSGIVRHRPARMRESNPSTRLFPSFCCKQPLTLPLKKKRKKERTRPIYHLDWVVTRDYILLRSLNVNHRTLCDTRFVNQSPGNCLQSQTGSESFQDVSQSLSSIYCVRL